VKGFTTYADRQEMVTLHQAGLPFWKIARQTGWRYGTVRQVIRRYKREGESALQPKPIGRPAKGPLSTFDPKVRFAVLKIKRQHPRWGPDIVRADLGKRAWIRAEQIPSSSSIGAYWSQFGNRLLRPRSHKRLSQAQPQTAAKAVVHGCWQLDVDERVPLAGVGRVHILNIVDTVSGLKLGALLFPSEKAGQRVRVSWPQYRQALRQAFARWGLPDRIRTDRDRVIVAKENYPFPMSFTLWLTGLGIEHELIRRVTQNGCVERSHWTWECRLEGYGPFDHLSDWQVIVDYERWRMNAVLPSRGRNCRRQPPLLIYPQARLPRRFFRSQDEAVLFDEQRVADYLAQGAWLRRTSLKGQFSLNGHTFNLGVAYKKRWVHITFLPEIGFQAVCPPEKTVCLTFQLPGLAAADLMGLPANGFHFE
jgi:hypothetical protein